MNHTPTYDLTAGVPVVRSYTLGIHQVDVLADGTIAICDTKIEDPSCTYTADNLVRLDREEAYRLMQVLHELLSL